MKQAGWKSDSKTNEVVINGQKYKFFKSREIQGKIKIVTIKRDNVGDMYIYFVTDYLEEEVKVRSGKSVGFDFGFKENILIAQNEEEDIPAPSFLRSNMKKLKKASKNFSSKKTGSKNFHKARLSLARVYRKADNQRNDFHWKLARKLCKEYSLICVESLNLKFMQKKHGKKMQDYGFGKFLQILEYVAARAGTKIVKIDKFFPSSQICSSCGEKNPEVKDLKIREWICPKCGANHDRDRNAAKNILAEGIRITGGASSVGGD